VAVTPLAGDGPEALLKNADSAMYKAKARGGNRVELYTQEMSVLAQSRLSLESELHAALSRDELVVHYQPQVKLDTGEIVGVEALVRWQHPRLGLLAPDQFVPIAEESGLVTDLDGWVLRKTLDQLRSWINDGRRPVRVSVNLSGRTVADGRTVGVVVDALRTTGLDPRLLEVEVTESVALAEDSDAFETLTRLRELGVGVAIDDFGTRYSVLGRLQRFPVTRLKVDRSFVAELEAEHSSAPIVVAIISMAHALGLPVVAEGVEDDHQLTFLLAQGCDEAQGWRFGRAVDAGELAARLPRRATACDDATEEVVGASA